MTWEVNIFIISSRIKSRDFQTQWRLIMKKTLTLTALMAVFLAGGSFLTSDDALAANSMQGSKAAEIVKNAADAKSSAETLNVEQPKVDPDEIATKAKEKANSKIDQVKQDMKDKVKESANEKIDAMKEKAGLNQAKEASPADKMGGINDKLPSGEKMSPARILQDKQ